VRVDFGWNHMSTTDHRLGTQQLTAGRQTVVTRVVRGWTPDTLTQTLSYTVVHSYHYHFSINHY